MKTTVDKTILKTKFTADEAFFGGLRLAADAVLDLNRKKYISQGTARSTVIECYEAILRLIPKELQR